MVQLFTFIKSMQVEFQGTTDFVDVQRIMTLCNTNTCMNHRKQNVTQQFSTLINFFINWFVNWTLLGL